MLEYIHSKKIELIILSAWILILNTYKIFFHVIGVDTEQALLEFDSNLNWTLGSGRFASAILRKILMPNGFSYDMAMLLTIVGWLSVCLAYMYCFDQIGIVNRWCVLFFLLLFVACPIWAEQSYFVCSSFINIYGMLCTIIAAYLLVNAVQPKFTSKNVIHAIILGVIAIGIYQALLWLLMANCIAFLSINMYSQKNSVRNYFISGLKHIVVITIVVILYLVCSKITITLLYNPSFDYAGHTDATKYISSNIRWFDRDVSTSIDEIIFYIMPSSA